MVQFRELGLNLIGYYSRHLIMNHRGYPYGLNPQKFNRKKAAQFKSNTRNLNLFVNWVLKYWGNYSIIFNASVIFLLYLSVSHQFIDVMTRQLKPLKFETPANRGFILYLLNSLVIVHNQFL